MCFGRRYVIIMNRTNVIFFIVKIWFFLVQVLFDFVVDVVDVVAIVAVTGRRNGIIWFE